MPKLHISKSIIIDAAVEKVFAHLNNFNLWQAWSPWLIMEPDAQVKIAGDAKYYQWRGKRVGEGNMQILSEQENRQIDYALNFIKPWKSKAKVSFFMKPVDQGIEVSWSMDTSLPFFLFWMKKMMIAFIGMDYERGLKMLKEAIEQGQVNSKLEFKGKSDFPAMHYIGIRRKCTADEISDAMQSDFTQLQSYIDEYEPQGDSKVFSIYHKWDMVKKMVDYTAGISVSNLPNALPSNISTGEIPATRIYTLRHIGSYEHLGNAWSTLYNMQQNKELKCKKGIHPFEIYVNNPKEVDNKELITDINFAIK